MKLLVIEDDKSTADYIAQGLREHGHVADCARDGEQGLMLAEDGSYDVLIIDRMLPKLDGLSLLTNLRGNGIKTPALFLTAMGALEDRVKGLESGGDDYLVKPFAFSELYARITCLARRPQPSKEQTVLQAGPLQMDLLRRTVQRDGVPLELQPTEFRLLEYLMRNHGRVVTRTMLLESVWDFNFEPRTSIVETHISRLRTKVDRGFDKEIIKTVRGSGYMIDA